MNFSKKFFIVWILFYSSFIYTYNQDVIRHRSTLDYYEIAENLFQGKKFFEAIRYYNKALDEKRSYRKNYELMYHLAESYRQSRLYEKAEKYYDEIVEQALNKFPLSLYWLAEMQMSLEKYDEARANFDKFLSRRTRVDREYKEKARDNVKNCQKAAKIIQEPVTNQVIALGKNVNKSLSNYAAFVRNDTIWFIGTVPITKKVKKVNFENVKAKYDTFYVNRLFISRYKPDEDVWSKRTPVEMKLPDHFIHMVSPAFDPDGNTLYFSLCSNENGEEACHIYKSDFSRGIFSNPQKLDEPVNLEGNSSKHPFITYLGSGKVMFFVSDRQPNADDYNIYYTIVKEDGTFGKVVDLGDNINTPYDEYAPFYDNTNSFFYFSSQGHVNLGGFDIFRAKGSPYSGWEQVKNIGHPANTGADDYYYIHYMKNKNAYRAFISSNRVNMQTLYKSTCCDKIYQFDYSIKKKKKRFTLKYTIYDQDKVPLDSSIIELYQKQNNENVMVKNTSESHIFSASLCYDTMYYALLYKEDYDTVEHQIIPPENDTFIFKDIFLNKIQKPVDVTAEKVDEEPKDDAIDQTDETDETEKQKPSSSPPAKKEDLEWPIIHYPFNVVKLTPKARYQLDKLTNQLKTSYTDINIVIASHTDNVDTREYNMKLSKRRTLTVMNYLMSKGIESSRLTGQWYGEEQPIAPNQFEDGRDNPQGRWINRRTIFSPVEKGSSVEQGQMTNIDKESYQPKGVQNMGSDLDEMTFKMVVRKYGEEEKDGLVFKIQIGAYRNPKKYMKFKMKMYAELQEKIPYLIQREVEGGLSKFLAGKAFSLNKAVELRDEIRDAGIKNAFIVAYYNRERINIVDVIEILQEEEQGVVEETPEIMQDTVPAE